MALDLRTFLCLRPCDDGRVCIRLPGVGIVRSWDTLCLQDLRKGFTGKRWEEETTARVSCGALGPAPRLLPSDCAGTPVG